MLLRLLWIDLAPMQKESYEESDLIVFLKRSDQCVVWDGPDKDIAGLTEHKGCVLIKQRIGRIKREDEIQNKHISDAKTT